MPTGLSALATDDEAQAADEGEVGANSLGNGDGSDGSGRSSGHDSDFRFVCIDNNNNVVVEEEPISELCEECFAENSALQTATLDFLADFEGLATFGTSTTDGVREISDGFIIGSETETIEQLCAQIENAVEELGVPLSDELIDLVFSFILNVDFLDPNPAIDALIECLLEEGIIVDRELPPFPTPDSISDNPITTQSNNPITTTTTTQSSNAGGGVPQSGNIVPSNVTSAPSSTLVNILPSNPN